MFVFAYVQRAWRTLSRLIRRAVRLIVGVVFRLGLLIGLLVLLGDGKVRDDSLLGRATALARDDLFDYVSWEADALWGKARQELFGVDPYLDAETQHDLVIDYLQRLSEVQYLEDSIERVYADPDIPDPDAFTAGIRTQRDALRRRLAADQPLVESIIEAQVSAVLVDEGFDWLGQVMPPVSMHFSELPTTLVVSPRDRIEFAVQLELDALSIEEREALESRIDSDLDVSSLVVPLGGLSLYPSMIIEPSSRDLPSRVARAIEVTAHEWSHHYLIFFPLGWEYSARPETRIINETTASFFGQEIARKVMLRYYPDLPPPEYPSFLSPPAPPAVPLDPNAPPPFDFAHEMNVTRVQVDALLSQGKIEEAEAYMEARRREFVANGYAIRKLNQAYFAFYGGYQSEPGAGGADPTGPAVEQLRRLSPGLRAWLQTLRGITTRDQLLAAVESARTNP
jgi:hypothetical protein